MSGNGIRAKAVCVCRRGTDILVGSAYDESKDETYYGPPGGGIEFGERAIAAVRREMLEEFGAELADVTLLGVLENIFTAERQPGHEIVFVFGARLADPTLYQCEAIVGNEDGQRYVAYWLPLDHCGPEGPPLYPDGLRELLLALEHESR